MYFRPVALLSLSLFGASSGRLNDIVTDFEDVATCGAKKKEFCNEGTFFEKMKKTLIDAPVVEGFYVDEDEIEAAQGAINDLIFYFQKKCKNCVEEEAKDELCALKDPIYQGIFDWVSDTMKDTVETYCPPEDFVCGKKHYDHCNGDLYSKMTAQLKSTPKNGGVAAPEALNELNGFFTHVCKSCVDHGNAKALCDSTKAITAGIINNDDREYEDPTAKFCGELSGTPATPAKPAPEPAPAPEPKPAPTPNKAPVPASTNISKGKVATQNCNYNGIGVASKAIDGNTNGAWGGKSVTHTCKAANVWWNVKLGEGLFMITKIVVWNRTDCCGDRLNGATLAIMQDGKQSAIKTLNAGKTQTLTFGAGIVGNDVIVQQKNILSLAEVQVFGYRITGEPKNLSKGKKANQSCNYNGIGVASKAVDGNINGYWAKKSVTHTCKAANVWWGVKLGTLSKITKIVVYNRVDCCADRLNGATVGIFAGQTQKAIATLTAARKQVLAFGGGVLGDEVIIKQKNNYLSLAEVQVFG